MSQRSFEVVAMLAVRDYVPEMEARSSNPRTWTALARQPVAGGRCGAHRGGGASPIVRSAENLSRRPKGLAGASRAERQTSQVGIYAIQLVFQTAWHTPTQPVPFEAQGGQAGEVAQLLRYLSAQQVPGEAQIFQVG